MIGIYPYVAASAAFLHLLAVFPGRTRDRVEHPGTSGDGFQNLADSLRRGKTPAKKYLLAISQQIFLTYSFRTRFAR